MRTRFKTLTVGLVLATAAMAGCSSTTGSSGAVQNAATASASAAASSAASTGPTSSAEPVTPTDAPTEAPASPVASPTDSPSPSPSGSSAGPALLGASGPGSNDVCNAGLAYTCGDIGASGVGTVFYASATPFACGLNMDSLCNYLEVAPNGWNGKMVKCPGGKPCVGSPDTTSDFGSVGPGSGKGYKYCTRKKKDPVVPNASGTAVGSGFGNTSAMLTECDSGDAGELARGYTGGGMTDWSLPSLDELNALYYYPNRDAIGGFGASDYWSSSTWSSTTNKEVGAWYQDFMYAEYGPGYAVEANTNGVRPIRAF